MHALRRRGMRISPLALAAFMVSGCATHPATAPSPARSDTITADQIVKSEATNAYEVIERLKPSFLASRGPTDLTNASPTLPNVYVDDVPYGPMSTLTTIAATDIAMIRLYRAWEATYKFGTGNMGGVIDVYTRH